jgi:hypothetical protein
MEKKKRFTIFVCIVLCYSLLPLTTRAQSSAEVTLFSQGSINYPPLPTPSPTPTPTPSSPNLAPIPDGWYLTYGSGPQIIFLDASVAHNGNPSIRIEAHVEGVDVNHYRECDSHSFSVKAGDHIVFKIWIKTGHSTLGQDGVIGNGAIFGVDFYSKTHRLHEHSSDASGSFTDPDFWTYLDDAGQYVPFNSDWSYRQLDFYVPNQVLDDTTGQLATEPIVAIIPWIQAASYITPPNHAQDQGTAWFADAELYINP